MLTSLATSGALAVLPGAMKKGSGVTPITPYLGQVASRTYFPNRFASTAVQANCRIPHVASGDLTQLQAEWPGYFVSNSDGTLTASASNITYQATVEYPAGTIIGQFKWAASNSGVAVAGATTGLSDLLTLTGTIPDGARFWTNCYAVATAGSSLPAYQPATGSIKDTANGEKCNFGATVTNNINSPNSLVDDGTTSCIYPIRLVATTSKESFLIVGDSKAAGSGGTPNTRGDTGEIAQSLGAAGYAYINGGIGGIWNKYQGQNAAPWLAAKAYVSHVILQSGANDLWSGQRGGTDVQLEAGMQTLGSYFWDKPCIGATIGPISTGTFTSAGGQTVDSSDPYRLAYNTWLRTVPYPFCAIVDVAAGLEDPSNPGKWLAPGGVAMTADGLHCNNTGYAQIVSSGVINAATLAGKANITRPWTPVQLGVSTASLRADNDVSNANLLNNTPDGALLDNAVGNLGAMSQATSGSRPVYTLSAIGGLPAYVFNGSKTIAHGTGGKAFTNGAAAVTVLVVGSYSAVPGSPAFMINISRAGTTQSRASLYVDSTGKLASSARRLDADTGINTLTTSVPGINNPFVFLAKFDPTNNVIENRLNGAVDGTGVYASSGSIQATDSNASLWGTGFTGTVGVTLIITRALTLLETQKLEGWAAWKWGLQANLPGGHPYKSAAP